MDLNFDTFWKKWAYEFNLDLLLKKYLFLIHLLVMKFIFSKLLALHSNGIFIKINTHPGSIVFGGL